MFSVPSWPGENLGKVVKIPEQVKTPDCVSGFHWSALEFSQKLVSVFPLLENIENMFYFLNEAELFYLDYLHWRSSVAFVVVFTFPWAFSFRLCQEIRLPTSVPGCFAIASIIKSVITLLHMFTWLKSPLKRKLSVGSTTPIEDCRTPRRTIPSLEIVIPFWKSLIVFLERQ